MTDRIRELEKLVRDNFDDDTIVLTEDTLFEEIEEWDSIEQVNVITMIEGFYGFKFNVGEMTALSSAKSAGEMIEVITKKLE